MTDNIGTDERQAEIKNKKQAERDRSPKHQSEFESLMARVRSLVRSTWKSFSYDHHHNLQRLRQDASDCAAAFLLSCLFCLACAASFTVIEGGYQEELRALKASEREEVLARILLQESEAVEELWRAAQEAMSEEEWKGVAMRRLQEVNEAAIALRGCEMGEVSEASDWGIMDSFVYMLTVTTSIGESSLLLLG